MHAVYSARRGQDNLSPQGPNDQNFVIGRRTAESRRKGKIHYSLL